MPDAVDNLLILYKSNIKKVLMSDMVEDYMSEFERQYALHFERYTFASYDRTAPSVIKSDVMAYVRNSVTKAIEALDPRGEMHLSAIDLDVFSRPDKADTNSLRLFHFYLYGTPGIYVSISLSLYNKIFASRRGSSERLGRFGTMFMMEYSAYERLYDTGNGGANGWPAPNAIKHPFSGAPPVRIFESVWAKIEERFDKYTKKAMDITTKT